MIYYTKPALLPFIFVSLNQIIIHNFINMKTLIFVLAVLSVGAHAQMPGNTEKKLYIDVHYLPEGKVKAADVANAHAKDVAVQSKHGVQFLKYWVDEPKGIIYCLSSAPDSQTVVETHREAHGLLPQRVYMVAEGTEATANNKDKFFLDIHELGADKVTVADVEKAHQADLAKQDKHNVKFVNYWVDEHSGTVFCLSQAKKSSDVIETHKEAHGLVPVSIVEVKQGQ